VFVFIVNFLLIVFVKLVINPRECFAARMVCNNFFFNSALCVCVILV